MNIKFALIIIMSTVSTAEMTAEAQEFCECSGWTFLSLDTDRMRLYTDYRELPCC